MSSDNNTTSIPISGVDAARQLGLGGSGGGSGGSGVGKNKARKTKRSAEEEATKKAQLEQKLLRQKAFDNAKMPEFTPYQQKTVPYGWKRPDHGWLVCERVNCIPPDYLARMVAWMLCHLSPIINRVPTPREISAANGININDLYLRFMMRPIGVFANKEDAKAFAVEASKSLDGTITMLAFYEPNVQPPYTTAEVIHRDKEVAKFMSTFKKHEQAERKEFEDHVVEIYKEIQTLSARSQSETKKLQAEQAALGGNEAIKPPPKLNELVDTGMIFAENPELEKKKLDDLEAAIDEDKDWLERCLVCDDPKGELAKIISASQGFIEGFEWREMAVKKHLALLREKVKIARAQFQICVDEETETEEDVEDTSSMKDKLEQIASHLAAAPSAPSASSKTRVKRFIESPDKTQLYAVTMDDKALLIKPSERDLYEAVETTAPETSSCDDVINEDVWYDCENPRPKRLTREQRMAAAGLCEEMLNNGSDEIDGGINDTRAVLSAYNERMRKQREHEQELIAQGIDPRTVYPLPKDPSLD